MPDGDTPYQRRSRSVPVIVVVGGDTLPCSTIVGIVDSLDVVGTPTTEQTNDIAV